MAAATIKIGIRGRLDFVVTGSTFDCIAFPPPRPGAGTPPLEPRASPA